MGKINVYQPSIDGILDSTVTERFRYIVMAEPDFAYPPEEGPMLWFFKSGDALVSWYDSHGKKQKLGYVKGDDSNCVLGWGGTVANAIGCYYRRHPESAPANFYSLQQRKEEIWSELENLNQKITDSFQGEIVG